ncbi:MAG TPA: response regulator [Polyangiaceae bacterium]|nr:response regulator [Polyangiaceae bacterium]
MSQRKILVIDDSEIVLEVTRVALEAAGHRVVTHDRAAGCVALILQEKPDLVLMDVNMPHLSGDTIIGVLGKAQPTGDTVMLLHSSLAADILRVKAETVGAHGFIQKTGDLFALVREVNRWLKRTARTSNNNLRGDLDFAPGAHSSSSKLRVAMDVGAPSSGRLRAAPEFGAASVNNLRAGPDLNLPNQGQPRSLPEVSLASEEEPRSSGTRPVAARSTVPTVLLVDRDMAVLSTFRRYLQSDQLSVEYALSGSAALRSVLSDNPPDVAVCDAFMSDLSGLDLYRRALAAALNWRQRMILTVDARNSSGLEEFRGHLLVRPVSAEALRSAVRACLAQRGAVQPGRAAAP